MCSWLWALAVVGIKNSVSCILNLVAVVPRFYSGVINSSSVISPAEFLSLTAFFICSTPSRVKRFFGSAIVFLHTCTIMIIIVIMTITMIDSINVVVCTGFSELMIIMRCVK